MKVWKALVLGLALLLPACKNYLTQEEQARIRELGRESAVLFQKEKQTILELYRKHQAGQLTTTEFINQVVAIKAETQAQAERINAEIRSIEKAAEERGLDFWKWVGSVIGSFIVGAFGVKSPGIGGILGKLFRKKTEGAPA